MFAIAPVVAGKSATSRSIASSAITIADASSGSRNPAACPTARQLPTQNRSRCPDRKASRRGWRRLRSTPGAVRARYPSSTAAARSSSMCAEE